jgi:hypothetical protein
MDFNQILALFPYRSESLIKYNESFLAASQAFNNPEKNGEATAAGNTKYEYAKIDQIYKAVENSLHKNSLYITHQVIAIAVDKEILITTIMHTSGEFLRDIRHLVMEKPGHQGRGIAQTYSRKYAVLCLCALATTDDDAQAEEKFIEQQNAEQEKKLTQKITAEEAEEIKSYCENELYKLTEQKICDKYQIKNLYHLTYEQYVSVKMRVEQINKEQK